jgi:phosphoesterase RecJ-like protein
LSATFGGVRVEIRSAGVSPAVRQGLANGGREPLVIRPRRRLTAPTAFGTIRAGSKLAATPSSTSQQTLAIRRSLPSAAIQHSEIRIPKSAFRNPHSEIRIPNSAFCVSQDGQVGKPSPRAGYDTGRLRHWQTFSRAASIPVMKIDWTPLREIIADNRRFVLTTHVRPDADAIGSEIAMAGLLELLGKEVLIVNASTVPDRLAFLDPRKKCLQLGTDITEEVAADTDVHMILDTSAWSQLAEVGRVFKKTQARKVVIDHHAFAEDLGALNLKDVEAEATGTLVFQFAEAMQLELTPEIGTAMFAAIATDTGWFRFPSTNGDTLRTIGALIDFGIRPEILYRELYEQSSLSRIKLASRVLSRMMLDSDGKLAWTYVTLVDYRETGAEPADTEELVNEGLTIAGVEASFILIEQTNGNIKASLRSRSHLDVSTIAGSYGGGGHKQAAGAMLPGPLAEAQAKILPAMKALFE